MVLDNPIAAQQHWIQGSGTTATLSKALLAEARRQKEYLYLVARIKNRINQLLPRECGQQRKAIAWKDHERVYPGGRVLSTRRSLSLCNLATTIGSFTVYAYVSCVSLSSACQPPTVMPVSLKPEDSPCGCTSQVQCTAWCTINDLYEFYDSNPFNWYLGIMGELGGFAWNYRNPRWKGAKNFYKMNGQRGMQYPRYYHVTQNNTLLSFQAKTYLEYNWYG